VADDPVRASRSARPRLSARRRYVTRIALALSVAELDQRAALTDVDIK
jgi:hypothetical protein